MPTVVLIGFSSAGKSSVLAAARMQWPTVVTVESDEWVAGGRTQHIYGMFLELGPEAALPMIEPRERDFLKSLQPTDEPRLIAAGPGVPRHDMEWNAFLARVRPEVVYLRVTPEQVLEGLRDRATRHLAEFPEMREDPNFGSWDEGVTTERTADGWRPVPRDRAIANINVHLGRLVPRYERASRPELRFDRDHTWGDERDAFMEKIGRLLDV